jgi:hypothetical protein
MPSSNPNSAELSFNGFEKLEANFNQPSRVKLQVKLGDIPEQERFISTSCQSDIRLLL